MLSSNGLVLISQVNKVEKFVGGYDNIEGFAEVDEPNDETNSEPVEPFVRRPPVQVESENKNRIRSEIEEIDTRIAEARARQREMAQVESENIAKAKSFGLRNVQMAQETSGKVQVNSAQTMVSTGKVSTAPKMSESRAELNTMDIILPKIYFTSERVKLFEHCLMVFGDKKTLNEKDNFMIKNLNVVMEGLSNGRNPEIRIANLIGLLIRALIIFGITEESKKLGDNIFNQNDMIEWMALSLSELLSDFPSDKCVFYNEKYNFVTFTPDICQTKQSNTSSGKCSECTQVVQECPKQKECPKVLCPDVKCPQVVLPEMKCPPVVLPEMHCPPVVIPEIKAQEVKCPAVSIPEMKCPVVNVPEMKCPEVNIESSSPWKYTSILLVLLLVGFAVYMIWSNRNNLKSSSLDITNLSRLSK
jgi:hypothetical protein